MIYRTGSKDFAEIRNHISGRDLAIIGIIADLRLMSGRQIEILHSRGTRVSERRIKGRPPSDGSTCSRSNTGSPEPTNRRSPSWFQGLRLRPGASWPPTATPYKPTASL
jgi:hypothetical protein